MFQRLRKIQAFEQEHFPFLESPLDSVLIAEIGYYQEQGRPLTMKGVLLLKLGAPATVRRRIQRLVGLGVLHKRGVRHDRRVFHLEIDSAVRMKFVKYLKLISRL